MTKRLQLGVAVLAATMLVALPHAAVAQQSTNPHPDRPPQVHSVPHASSVNPHPHNNTTGRNRPPNAASPAHPQGTGNGVNGNNGSVPHNNFNNGSNNGSNNSFNNAPPYRSGAGANFAPRVGANGGSARPWVDTMRSLTPQQRENVLRNSKAFQNLSPDKQSKIRQQFNQWDHMTPQQRSDLQSKEQVWGNLTPGQRDHIKNDVLPQWRQMPWDRQQVMKQKLNVLQNMPESARNQRLNDPNFTHGMSDDEKSMLHDLSHTHVGGVPEPPAPTQ
jgi:hypothetical protein